MTTQTNVRLLLAALVCLLIAICPVLAQNPSSCTTSGFSGYSYTTTNDGTNTTLHFTFYNRSPIGGVYVNIGEIYFDGLPVPVGTPTAPSGWVFNQIGPKLFYATTSNPWWKTPPAIKPGDSLTGFDYTISGLVVPDFVVFTHVQNVTDANGTTAGPLGTWFDCSVIVTPPEDNPCISIIKTPSPLSGATGDVIEYGYEVCNCGNTDLTVISLTDTLLGDLLDEFVAANGDSADLPVDTCVTFSVSRTILESDPNPIPNCVTVEADPPTGPPVSDTKCASVVHIQTNPFPCIELTKSVYPTQALVGQQVIYTYKVCNCGDEPLTVTSLVDDVLGDLTSKFIAANGSSNILGVESCVSFNVLFTIPDVEPGPFYNCATVQTSEGPESTACARVDVSKVPPPFRVCDLPVTLTQEGWRTFADPYNSILPGSIFNRFSTAFASWSFYGSHCKNEIAVGLPTTCDLVFKGTAFGLYKLCCFLPQTGPVQCFKFNMDLVNPTVMLNNIGHPVSNALAGEALALTLNIGYNDMCLMPRTPGYNLEDFIITQGPFKYRTVGEILDMANRILGGTLPCQLGLQGNSFDATVLLAAVIHRINENYEFQGFDTFIDRGYLKPVGSCGKFGMGLPIVVP
ncbi:MAG: hypothetical protein ABFD83_09790 [Armatimonadota bacterium]